MPAYFVDSWFLIAVGNRLDDEHRAASRIEQRLAGARFVTHDGILSEVLTYFCEAGAFHRQRGVAMVRRALRDFTVEPMTRTLFIRGMDRYAARLDKEYSHVDCMSMIVMEDLAIQHVLTNDHHFQQEGFTLVNA